MSSSISSVVHIDTAVPYDVYIGGGLLERAGHLIRPVARSFRAMLITDDIVDNLYGEAVLASLKAAGFQTAKHVFVHGEALKNIATWTAILEDAAEQKLTRKDLLVALGGGVVGDIAGFAASVYMRGIDFIQIPTTLLAAVDASVGGKTAVDLRHGKNLAGSFWQPRMVICDCDVMRELPTALLNCGMSEVIKHGVIGDENILRCIDRNEERSSIDWLIRRNIEIKRDVVEADERESGSRRILNFGHTVAHAIEKLSDYQIPHGVAVGTGMIYETRLAESLGICGKGLADELAPYCRKYGLYFQQAINDAFVQAMTLDKKNEDNKIVFALPKKIGSFTIVKLSEKEVQEYLM